MWRSDVGFTLSLLHKLIGDVAHLMIKSWAQDYRAMDSMFTFMIVEIPKDVVCKILETNDYIYKIEVNIESQQSKE